jgi:hypothetical protein
MWVYMQNLHTFRLERLLYTEYTKIRSSTFLNHTLAEEAWFVAPAPELPKVQVQVLLPKARVLRQVLLPKARVQVLLWGLAFQQVQVLLPKARAPLWDSDSRLQY